MPVRTLLRFLGLLCALFLVQFPGSPGSAATVYEIEFAGTRTRLSPFETAQTGAAFYNYINSEAHPPFALTGGTAQLYLHRNTAAFGPRALSLGLILNTGSGGYPGSLAGRMSGLPLFATLDLADDLSDVNFTKRSFSFAWSANFTDGMVIGGLGGTSLDLQLDITKSTGIYAWRLLQGDPRRPDMVQVGGFGTGSLLLSTREVPLPATLPLLALALAGFGILAHLGRRPLAVRARPCLSVGTARHR